MGSLLIQMAQILVSLTRKKNTLILVNNKIKKKKAFLKNKKPFHFIMSQCKQTKISDFRTRFSRLNIDLNSIDLQIKTGASLFKGNNWIACANIPPGEIVPVLMMQCNKLVLQPMKWGYVSFPNVFINIKRIMLQNKN